MNLTQYEWKLAEVLETRDVNKLTDFVLENQNLYAKGWIENWKQCSQFIKQMTFCKMCCNALHISKETREWASNWLKEHNAKETI